MSKIGFDDNLSLGYILEGVLRKNKKGTWFIEKHDGSLERLGDALDRYKNKEIRLTMVDLMEAEYLQDILQRGNEDDDGRDGTDK